jgi:uncharacterized protein
MAIPFKMFVGGPIGSGSQQVSWIHLDDEVRALRFLIENPDASGAFNLSAPEPLSNFGFSKSLARALGRPAFVPAPGFAFKIAFGELSMLLLEGQRVIPRRLQEMGFQFHYPEAEGALRDLFEKRK